jgi:hypothetical protein
VLKYKKSEDREHVNKQQLESYHRRRAEEPERMKVLARRNYVKTMYNVDAATMESKLKSQGNKCDVCGDNLTVPFVDHNHACCPGGKSCGKCVRGLLCRSCNMLLGFAKDDIDILTLAVKYLRKYSCSDLIKSSSIKQS